MRAHKHIGFWCPKDRRRYFTGPITSLLTDVGVGAETAADIASPVSGGLIGAGLGAAGGAIFGKPALGAEIGGGLGLAGGVLQDLGVVPTIGGGGSGGGGAPVTDTSGLTTPTGTPAGSAAAPSGLSAATIAAPAGAAPVDLTGLDLTPSQAAEFGASNPASAATVSSAIGAGGTPASGGGVLKDITSGNFGALPGDIGTAISKNPAALVAGGGLLLDTLKSQKIPGEAQLNSQAAQLAAQGKQLSSYVTSGNLPPGVQAAIDQATQAAEATIRSRYAQMGPGMENSTMAIQDINAMRENAVVNGFKVAESLLQSGIQESQLSASLYQSLLQFNAEQAAQTGQAISNFAMALNGYNPATTLRVA